MNGNLEFSLIATRINNSLAPVGITPSTTRNELRRTRSLLDALRLTAQAEMEEQGYNTDIITNPVDALINPIATRPFFNQFTNAMNRATRQSAFEPREATPNPNTAFISGARVQLTARPLDHISLPERIPIGAEGVLAHFDPNLDDGYPGWNVIFDDYGTWWTTTDTLGLL